MKKSKQGKNQVPIEITPIGPKEKPYVTLGKGRNSVSQKVFGVRAHVAIKTGLALSIKQAARGANQQWG